MAIYTDDFQSYAVGATAPFGSLTNFGFFPTTIRDVTTVSPPSDPQGIFGATKCIEFFGSGLELNTLAAYTPAVSVFFGAKFRSWDESIMSFASDTHALGSIRREADGTISIYLGALRLATSTASLRWYNWYFFQCNFTWTNVGGFVQIDAEIAVDGVSIVSVSYITTITVASLTGLGANLYDWTNTYFFGALTVDIFQSIGTDPNPGTPLNRVTQTTIEQVQLPSSALLRTTQGAVEQAQLPSNALLRVTQAVIELVVGPSGPTLACPIGTGAGVINVPYTSTLVVSGGSSPFTFTLIG